MTRENPQNYYIYYYIYIFRQINLDIARKWIFIIFSMNISICIDVMGVTFTCNGGHNTCM